MVSVRGIGDHEIVRPIVRIDRLPIGAVAVDAPWTVPQGRHGYFVHQDAVGLLGNGILERFSAATVDCLRGTPCSRQSQRTPH